MSDAFTALAGCTWSVTLYSPSPRGLRGGNVVQKEALCGRVSRSRDSAFSGHEMIRRSLPVGRREKGNSFFHS